MRTSSDRMGFANDQAHPGEAITVAPDPPLRDRHGTHRQHLLAAVHGRWRVEVWIVMILPSAQGLSSTEIAGLLGRRIRTPLTQPRAWTTARVWRELGRPAISLRTSYRRIREQASKELFSALPARTDPATGEASATR